LSIQINFQISLESDSLGVAALSSLESAASSGTLATSFAEEASKRNEIVSVVATVLSTTCSACSIVAPIVDDNKVAETTYKAVGSLQIILLMALIGLWVFVFRDVHRSANETHDDKAKVSSLVGPLEDVEMQQNELSADTQGVTTQASDEEMIDNTIKSDAPVSPRSPRQGGWFGQGTSDGLKSVEDRLANRHEEAEKKNQDDLILSSPPPALKSHDSLEQGKEDNWRSPSSRIYQSIDIVEAAAINCGCKFCLEIALLKWFGTGLHSTRCSPLLRVQVMYSLMVHK
jgi:hypothetical protein